MAFDPYHKWLGISPDSWPPTHYQILGISPDERDAEVINAAVIRQSAYVRNFQAGQYSKEATQILNEIAGARVCLLDPVKRAEYDAGLKPPDEPAAPARQATPKRAPVAPKPAAERPRDADPFASLDHLSALSSASPLSPSSPLSPNPLLPNPLSPRGAAAAAAPRRAPAAYSPLDAAAASLDALGTLPPAKGGLQPSPLLGGSRRRPTKVWLGIAGGGAAAVALVAVILFLTRNDGETASNELAQNTNQGGTPFGNPAFPGTTGSSGTTGSFGTGSPGATTGSNSGTPVVVNSGSNASNQSTTFPAASNSAGTSRPTMPVAGVAERVPAAMQQRSAPAQDDDDTAPTQSPSPIAWDVKADPLPEPLELKNEGELELKVPTTFSGAEIIFPLVPSTCVAVGSNRNRRDVREIWNLNGKRKLGVMSNLDLGSIELFALSPDGLHCAAHFRFPDRGVGVWDVKAKKNMGTLEFDEFFPKILAFPTSQRLVAAADEELAVWQIPSGNLEGEYSIPRLSHDQAYAFSPGGRYLAMIARDSSFDECLFVVDLNDGDIVGEVALPKFDGGSLRAEGLAFSWDGKELAGVFDQGIGNKLLCWNMSNGDISAEHTLTPRLDVSLSNARSYKGPPLEYFPNKKQLLVHGHGIFDLEAGSLVWTFPNDATLDAESPRKVVQNRRIVVSGSNRNARLLGIFKVPEADLEKGAKVVDSGGLAVDTQLPSLTGTDWSKTKLVPLNEAANWDVSPDPAPKGPAKLLDRPLALKTANAQADVVMVSQADAARAVVMMSPPSTVPLALRRLQPDSAGPIWLDVYDLSPAKHRKKIDIPYSCMLQAVSPDGGRALVRLTNGESRLDVWDLDSGKHVCGWRPFKEEEESKQKVEAAAFVDAEHVVTISNDHLLVLWKLPECRAVYAMGGVQQPGLSAGRKYLAVANSQSYRFFEALTGEPAGDLVWDGIVQAAAFHPDGKRFAAVILSHTGTALVCWNLADGEKMYDFPLPRGATTMHWCGEEHLLLDNNWLVDTKHRMVVWKYELLQGVHVPDSPDGRHWYAAGRGAGTPGILLAAIAMPDERPAALLAAQTLKPKMLLEPGGKVTLEANLGGIQGMPTFAEDVKSKITARFAEKNITVSVGQNITLQLRTTQGSNGEVTEYSSFGFGIGGGRQVERVTEAHVDCKATFVSGGKTVWEQASTFSNRSYGFVSQLEQNETVTSHLSKQMWSQVSNFFLNFVPPSHVFAEGAEGLGSSTLTAAGASINGQ